MELNQLTLYQAKKGIQEKKFSGKELVRACLKQIKKQKTLNALITVCEKAPDGLPIIAKDNFSTEGVKTTAGSRVLENYIPPYDATVIKKLKEFGATIIGKANMDAWAHGSSGENSDFGPTKNPHDPSRVPGGSSSGPAVSVAANICLAATGTDTGGSVRLPASFCGVVGLKPTYGRVSRYGIIAMGSSLDAIGHLTKDVTDSALLLNVTAGRDSLDATTPNQPIPDYTQSLNKSIKGLKIGIPQEYFEKGLNPKIKAGVLQAIKALEKAGVEIIDVSLPHTQYAIAAYYIIQPSEVSSNLARYDGIRYGFGRKKFGDEAKRRIMLGTYTLSSGYYEAYYLKAMKVRSLIKQDFEKVFEKVDCLIAPVSPDLPFKLNEKTDDPLKMYLSDILTVPANLAGVPALSIPIGRVDDLPVGLQIIGPQFKEELLFQVGYQYEQATNHR